MYTMSRLRFIKKKPIHKLAEILPEIFSQRFKKGDKVAVKLHMGEYGNINYIRPIWARTVVDALKSAGTEPFLFDSPTLYKKKRHTVSDYHQTAKMNGYTEETMGCPIIISDEGVEHKTEHLDVSVCNDIADADGMVVLTHIKGHICTGIGGAIKNLGMGAVSKKTKSDIHEGCKPVIAEGCISCGKCVEVCPGDCFKLAEGKKLEMDLATCYGCSICVLNCPAEALKSKFALFYTLIAEGASAVLKKLEGKSVYYINLLYDLSEKCDCVDTYNPLIAPNIGVLAGYDIAAIDQASIELINKKAGKKVFDLRHKRPSELHISEAERLGIGSREYDIEDT
ncbi:DUF362 domain-containing protein [Candidatus Woesearchaeota archaeon]|nr:DUF362 domain-containing protein [Candidatus Woesearchaeota archaeon]